MAPYYYAFYDATGTARLVSLQNNYASQMVAQNALSAAAANVANGAYYYVQPQSNGTYTLFLTDTTTHPGGTLLASDGQSYPTEAAAQDALEALLALFTPPTGPLPDTTPTYGTLGWYLVEHLLLRPRAGSPDFQLMDVCLGKDCQFCGEQDPYTFRA